MTYSHYREKRAKVTQLIIDTLTALVDEEKDFTKPKKHPAAWYRENVAKLLKLNEASNPSLRSYEEALKPIRKAYEVKNILDTPWSIGTSIAYGIPADIIPLLIEYRRDISSIKDIKGKKRDLSTTRLTIRKARWMARLYPVAKSLLEDEYPDSLIKQRILLSSLADEYCRRERLAEIAGKNKPPDTHFLDTLVFVLKIPIEKAKIQSIIGEYTPDQMQNFNKLVNGLEALFLKDGEK